MGISRVIGSIATVPAAVAVAFGSSLPQWMTLALTHVSICGFAVALASSISLCHHSTGLLGKGKEGLFSPLAYVAWLPYHGGLHVRLWWRRRTRKEPLFNQITPGWYLGGWPYSASALPQGKLAVVDVTCELPRTHKKAYHCIPVWDTRAPTPKQIQSGVKFALQERASGAEVFVHCAHGHGRSATVLAACLLASKIADTPESAVAFMKQARPKVRLNSMQRSALNAWYDQYAAFWQPSAACELSATDRETKD